ncbi:MAG: hypothetical protein NTY12_00625 [Candidatus Falkowbacteria bacterium]|nr:hypothetical protein [Candidatus Falkowbacteria bacterium]
MKNLSSNNKSIYLPIILLLVILIVAGVLFFVKKTNNQTPTNNKNLITNDKKEPVFDSNKYKTLVRGLFARLSPANPADAQQVKKELLDITVSKEFKEVHFELVMASASLEDYSLSRDEKSLTKAKTILDKLKKDYTWLSDKSL